MEKFCKFRINFYGELPAKFEIVFEKIIRNVWKNLEWILWKLREDFGQIGKIFIKVSKYYNFWENYEETLLNFWRGGEKFKKKKIVKKF